MALLVADGRCFKTTILLKCENLLSAGPTLVKHFYDLEGLPSWQDAVKVTKNEKVILVVLFRLPITDSN